MSAPATSAHSPRGLGARPVSARLPIVDAETVYVVVLAAALAWVAVRANGGLRIGSTTAVEVALDVTAGVVGAVALLAARGLRRADGVLAGLMFGLFVIASMVSTIWSVDPSQSWIEANRLITYLAVFGIGMALVRLAPHRWGVVLGGVTLAAVVVSAYALGHKTLPAQLAPTEVYGRLQEPFGYWNAVGLMAALGVPGCLWLGARRAGHAALNAFAYPAAALLLVVLLLSYSRGALLALLVGCGFWFALVPLRLRGAAVLAVSGAGAAAIIAWTFSQPALTDDRVPLEQRTGAGHELLLAVLVTLLVLLLAGLLIGFAAGRRAPARATRRRLGAAILVALALVPVVGAVGLAGSERGLGGSISHTWNELTDTSVDATPSNDPSRLTAAGSVRARYWSDAWKVFEDHPITGAGSGGYAIARLRYRTDTDNVQVAHAHGYVVQVLADRGLLGIALSFLAFVAVAVAIARSTGIGRRGAGSDPMTPERVGLLTMASVVVIFGVHSFVDWSWFIPGVTIPPLLLCGWLVARGVHELPARPERRLLQRIGEGLRSRQRVIAAGAAIALATAAAWAAWQPQRSIDAYNASLDALDAGKIAEARRLAIVAHDRNPLSIDPYIARNQIEVSAGDENAALHALQEAVRLQPANPSSWSHLAEFQLKELKQPAAAKRTLSAALYLDPRDQHNLDILVEANRAIAAKQAARETSRSSD